MLIGKKMIVKNVNLNPPPKKRLSSNETSVLASVCRVTDGGAVLD